MLVDKMKTRILVIGASGMLGSTLLRYFADQEDVDIFATARSPESTKTLSNQLKDKILFQVDIENINHLLKTFSMTQPDVVINCVGVIKQLTQAKDPLTAIPINSILPHRLAHLAATSKARLIHFSTDCVFSGAAGNYSESDCPDALDLYGRSKLIGEVDYPNAITLRTSLIGHELSSNRSLVNWFLSQTGSVKGFRKAIFSGLPTIEIARVIHEFVLPNPELHGLYHLSVKSISKFDLLSLIAKVYSKDINIIPDDSLVVDRSLDSSRFCAATGFSPRPWPELIQSMYDFG